MLIDKGRQLLEIFTAILCIHMLYGKKFVLKLPLIVIIGIDLTGYAFITKYGFSNYSNIMVYVSLIIYSAWIFESSIKELIVNTILLAVSTGILQIIAMLTLVQLSAITGVKVEISDITFGSNLLVLMLTLFIDKVVGYVKIKKYILLQKSVTVVIASISMTSIIYGFFSVRITSPVSAVFFICVVVVCSFVCITCFQWMRQKELTKEKEIDLQIYELYNDSFQALLQELRARQHDFKNHIQAIRNQHYVCKDYETLVLAQRTYCDEILSDDKYAGLLGCGNSTIAGFLYGKFTEVEKKGVHIKYTVRISSQQYAVPLYVIIETLGILLDNAAEYVINREHPYITLEIYETLSELCIKTENPIEQISIRDFMNYFEPNKSTKGQGRGIGLAKLKKYAEKYQWEIVVDKREEQNSHIIMIHVRVPVSQGMGK